jgi:hypothetical protein
MAEADFTPHTLLADDRTSFVPAGTFRAFEMPDDSMHPRIMKGELAIIESSDDRQVEVGDDVLVQLSDGRWLARLLAGYTDKSVRLAAYNLPAETTLARSDIAKLYRIDLVVPAERLAIMTSDGITTKDAMMQRPIYRDFENPDVIVTTYGDKRIGCLSDEPCRAEQAWNGPTYLVIRPTATDEQLGKAAQRYGLDMDYLKAFRANVAR